MNATLGPNGSKLETQHSLGQFALGDFVPLKALCFFGMHRVFLLRVGKRNNRDCIVCDDDEHLLVSVIGPWDDVPIILFVSKMNVFFVPFVPSIHRNVVIIKVRNDQEFIVENKRVLVMRFNLKNRLFGPNVDNFVHCKFFCSYDVHRGHDRYKPVKGWFDC